MAKSKKPFIVYPSHQANCIALLGDSRNRVVAGYLLYRIYCRSQSCTYKCRQGIKGWAALTRDQWLLDTGLTLDQYKYALSTLKKKKLIIWKGEKKGKGAGGATLLAKVSPEIKKKIESQRCLNTPSIEEVYESNSNAGQKCTETPPIYKREKNINGKKEKCISSDIKSLDNTSAFESEKKDSRRRVKLKIKQSSKKDREGKSIKVRINQFEAYWKTMNLEIYPDVKLVDWTGTFRGYAKSILLKLDKLPENYKRRDIMTAIIQHWDESAGYVRAQRGIQSHPDHPCIGFIAASPQHFIHWYKDHKSSEGDSDRREATQEERIQAHLKGECGRITVSDLVEIDRREARGELINTRRVSYYKKTD